MEEKRLDHQLTQKDRTEVTGFEARVIALVNAETTPCPSRVEDTANDKQCAWSWMTSNTSQLALKVTKRMRGSRRMVIRTLGPLDRSENGIYRVVIASLKFIMNGRVRYCPWTAWGKYYQLVPSDESHHECKRTRGGLRENDDIIQHVEEDVNALIELANDIKQDETDLAQRNRDSNIVIVTVWERTKMSKSRLKISTAAIYVSLSDETIRHLAPRQQNG
ncbi:hypothetical protein HHI36_017593 [Cryptolaemus montrouzieri]|uniref:Uncharacterized protein n=1 Tax=Cryptolaemus montrouzieri TaxID=559131 RepID=A0ABD2NN06_9CUCU